MELKFEELEVPESEENKLDHTNYWSNISSTTNEKKPKISYDDILSSLNMVVNNGVLQFAKPPKEIQQPNQQPSQLKQEQKKRVTINTENNQQQQYNYITNKYFKNYKEEKVIEEQEIPMTKEEYRQMMIQEYINRQQAQKRISEIKSRKLLFDTRHINISPNQMPRDMNKLFKTFPRR